MINKYLRKNWLFLVVILSSGLYLSFTSNNEPKRVVVKPVVIDDVLNNPGIGFNTFQHFNGDSLFPGSGWREGFPIEYQDFDGDLTNEVYPQTSIAYWRVYWQFIEPEEQNYSWDLIDQALDTARSRGQKLLLRIAPYGTGPEKDVPDWYREMVGENTVFAYDNPVNKWAVDPEDPRYVKYFGGLIREMGERYDGHPDLEAVDLSIVGAWGEGGGSELLQEETMQGLVDAYTDSFNETPLIALLMDEETNKYALSQGDNVGWRVDCIGDLGFWADDQNGWTHMYDFYPQAIIEYGTEETWKKAPVSLEICGTFRTWRDQQGYGEEEVKYIFDQALKWHISSFNAKSSPVPKEWEHLVDEWLKKMGYRFALRRFSYPDVVQKNGRLFIESWWENQGVAPAYREYPFAVRLKNKDHEVVLLTEADVRDWLPGDIIHDETLFIPVDMPTGDYEIQIGLVEKSAAKIPEPQIKLAIEGITSDGWYSMGQIAVEERQ